MLSIYPLIWSLSGKLSNIQPFFFRIIFIIFLQIISNNNEASLNFLPLSIWKHFNNKIMSFKRRQHQIQLLKAHKTGVIAELGVFLSDSTWRERRRVPMESFGKQMNSSSRNQIPPTSILIRGSIRNKILLCFLPYAGMLLRAVHCLNSCRVSPRG